MTDGSRIELQESIGILSSDVEDEGGRDALILASRGQVSDDGT